MKLFNKTIDRQLFKQYPLGSDLSKQEVVAKIFNPVGSGNWFILNSDPEDPDYLWAIVDLGYGAEVGSVSRSDLENYRGRFGMGFERDLSFDPVNALELYNGLRQGKYYADGGGVENKPYIFFFYDENGNEQIFKTLAEATKEAKQQGQQKVRDNLGEEYFVQYADGGEIEVVYERRADFKKKPIKLLLLNKGKEQKGYTFSGKDQVAVLDNYNRNKQEDLEKLWNLKGYESKYADGGDIESFTDNQQMIMNQNVELEHHHEELEDILEDEMPVPAWVVAKMATATQSVSDITHYLDGQKELMEDEDEEENEVDDEDQEVIKNQNVVEPINVSLGTKAELTKKFTDDAMGNLKGFLKGMEGIELRDDYTFDYKGEQFEVEPIINSDENGVSNAVFTIFDGDGEEQGEIDYSRDGGKQKFTANSDYFEWRNAKFEDGGFMNNVYADGGYFDGTIPKVSTYMTNYAKGGEVAKAEIIGLSKNILGTTSIEMKISGMRKSQDFSVYPIGKDDTDKIITIQSSTRIGKIDLSTGRGLMSQSHSNGAYFVHFQMDKLTPFTLNESDLEELKMHIFKTAGDNVGSRGIFSDNSGASGVYHNGGFMNNVYAKGGSITSEIVEHKDKDSIWFYQSVGGKEFHTSLWKKQDGKFEINSGYENKTFDKKGDAIEHAKKGLKRQIDEYIERPNTIKDYVGKHFVHAHVFYYIGGLRKIASKSSGWSEKKKKMVSFDGQYKPEFIILRMEVNNKLAPYDEKQTSKETTLDFVSLDTMKRWTKNNNLKTIKLPSKLQEKVDSHKKYFDRFEGKKLEDGGETEEGVDLFEDYENIPPKLQAILDKYEDAFQDGEYRGLAKALKEANAIGYTFEYYLDGQAYDLRKIGEKGKSEVEEYAKGGFMNDVYADGGELSNYTVTIVYPRLPLKGERSNWAYNENIDLDVVAKNETEAKKKALIKFSEMLPNEKPSITSVNSNKYKFLDTAELQDGGSMNNNYAYGGGLYKLLELALLEENGNEEYIDNLPKYPEYLDIAFTKNGGHKIYKVYETTMNNGKFVKYPTYRIGKDMKPYSKLKYVLKALDKNLYDENFDVENNYAKGGSVKKDWWHTVVNPNEDFNNYDDKMPIDWEVDDFKSWVVSNSDLDGNVDKEVLEVVKMPKSKLTVEYLNKNGSGKNNNEFYKEFGNWQSALYDIFTQMKKDYLFKKSLKYILKADIKTVTVKTKNGKEVTYSGADVLNGNYVLAKGGDITSKATYFGKNNVVEVELKDGTTIKPANGYWVKKGAEPIGAEPTPTSSGKYNAVAFDGKKQMANLSDKEYSDKIETFIKSNEEKGFEVIVDLMNNGKVEQQVYKTSSNKSNEPKISETEIRKDMRGNWRAETTVDNFNGYDWRLSTIKTYSGNLVSSAQGGKTEATGSKGIKMFIYTMYQDPNYTLEVSKPKRLTDKVVTEQHEKALAKFKKFMETGTFGRGGKISNFDKLSAKVAKEYEGKPVKSQYQEEYGKYYSKEEAQEVGDKVAGKVKALQSDKKAFGGLFSGTKSLVSSKKYPDLDDKQVRLKSGKYVQVFDQSGKDLLVLEVGKIGTGERPFSIDISEIDPTSYEMGGATFSEKSKAIAKNFVGKKVEPKYQKEYGKIYDSKEAREVGNKIAGSIVRNHNGSEILKKANILAKEIRKDGESWNDAKKRAFAQLKK